MVRTWLLAVTLLGACSSKSSSPGAGGGSGSAATIAGLSRAPKVTVAAAVVASPANPPPLVFVLDEQGGLHVNVVATWDELAKKNPLVGAYATDRNRANRRLLEGHGLGQDTKTIFDSFAPAEPGEVDLESLEDTSARDLSAIDDPPPPEEEDYEEASGGTGTAMGLDDRAEGQYKMKRDPVDAEHAAAIKEEEERRKARAPLHAAAGIRAPSVGAGRPGKRSPLTSAVVEVSKDGKLQQPAFGIVLAAPAAKAAELIDTIAATRAWIGVAHEGKVRPLRVETIPEREYAKEPKRWIELSVGKASLAFEAVPETPVPVASVSDQAAFAAALEKARNSRSLDPLTRVDVLVERSVDVQRLVDVLVALDQAGVVMIGLGRMPLAGAEEATLRGVRRTDVKLIGFNAQGDLDRASIKTAVAAKTDALRECFDTAHAKKPLAGGAVNAQFVIAPTGKVKSAVAAGVEPGVANCVASVVKAIEFPKPNAGGVQVNYAIGFDP